MATRYCACAELSGTDFAGVHGLVLRRDDVGRGLDGVRDAGGRVAEPAERGERDEHADGECRGEAEPQAGRPAIRLAVDLALERMEEVGARLRPLRAELPLEPVFTLPETPHRRSSHLRRFTLCP